MKDTEQEVDISLQQMLLVLWEQKVFIILFCSSAILTALALTYIASEKYRAATTIFYQPYEVMLLKMHDSQSFGAPSPIPPFKVIHQNLQELVKSEIILRAVVVDLGLHKEVPVSDDVSRYTYWYRETKNYLMDVAGDMWMLMKYGRLIESGPTESATSGLRERVSLIDRGSYIFYLVVVDKYPRRAAATVDAIAAELVSWLNLRRRSPGILKKGQLSGLLTEKSAEIEGYQREIERILSKNSMVSATLEAQKTMDRLSALELEGVKLKGEIESLSARLESVRRIYASRENGSQRVDQGSGDTIFIQPEDYKKLGSEKLFLTLSLDSTQAKYGSLQASIATLTARQDRLPEIQQQLDYNRTHLDVAKREFNLVSDAYQEAVVQASTLTSEAAVLHAANIPSEPFAPIKVYNVGLAAILSFFIAIGLVYLLDYANINLLFAEKKKLENSDAPTESA